MNLQIIDIIVGSILLIIAAWFIVGVVKDYKKDHNENIDDF